MIYIFIAAHQGKYRPAFTVGMGTRMRVLGDRASAA